MQKNRIYANHILKGLREFSGSLKTEGKVTDKFTCRTVTLDLHPIPYSPQQVKATRRLLRCSQALFAHFIGVKASTIQSWEQGRQNPPDIACRFMDEIQRNPEHWRKRLRQSIRVKESC